MYFPVFELNTGKYGPEKTPFLDTFRAVFVSFLHIQDFVFITNDSQD